MVRQGGRYCWQRRWRFCWLLLRGTMGGVWGMCNLPHCLPKCAGLLIRRQYRLIPAVWILLSRAGMRWGKTPVPPLPGNGRGGTVARWFRISRMAAATGAARLTSRCDASASACRALAFPFLIFFSFLFAFLCCGFGFVVACGREFGCAMLFPAATVFGVPR